LSGSRQTCLAGAAGHSPVPAGIGHAIRRARRRLLPVRPQDGSGSEGLQEDSRLNHPPGPGGRA
jgi:hypothetical protein